MIAIPIMLTALLVLVIAAFMVIDICEGKTHGGLYPKDWNKCRELNDIVTETMLIRARRELDKERKKDADENLQNEH